MLAGSPGPGGLLALSKEQAAIENQLQELAQIAANQQRRLDTNRVALNFRSADALERSSYVLRWCGCGWGCGAVLSNAAADQRFMQR